MRAFGTSCHRWAQRFDWFWELLKWAQKENCLFCQSLEVGRGLRTLNSVVSNPTPCTHIFQNCNSENGGRKISIAKKSEKISAETYFFSSGNVLFPHSSCVRLPGSSVFSRIYCSSAVVILLPLNMANVYSFMKTSLWYGIRDGHL